MALAAAGSVNDFDGECKFYPSTVTLSLGNHAASCRVYFYSGLLRSYKKPFHGDFFSGILATSQ